MGPWKVADINGDGKDDVMFSGLAANIFQPAPLMIWTANVNGSMEDNTESLIVGGIPTEEQGYRNLFPADFNGDGRLDLFLESHGAEPDCGDGTTRCLQGGQNSLLLSDDAGKLQNVTATHLPALRDFTHGSALLDFDSDGDLDIWVNTTGVCGGDYPCSPYLLENDGAGQFTIVASAGADAPPMPPGPNGILPEGNPIDVQLFGTLFTLGIDADGDGFDDLYLNNVEIYQPDDSIVHRYPLLRSDAGAFRWPTVDILPPGFFQEQNLGEGRKLDLNNDGLDDLLMDAYWQSPEGVDQQTEMTLISNGDGTFRDETVARYPVEPIELIRYAQLHDLDGDGHQDLFIQEGHDGRTIVSVNNGEGFFRPLDDDWVFLAGWTWAVLDVDGDGGTDFFQDFDGYVLHKMVLPYGPELEGTEEDDRLIGGAHDNIFRGLAGNDVLDGGLGDDSLHGGAGNDNLIGGKGNDRIYPGTGSDSVNGGPGRDTIEYDLGGANAQLQFDQVTQIQTNSGTDQVEGTEYALFSDDAIPLPTNLQSPIGSLNGIAGLWFDPSLDGEGFNVITTPSGTVIFFYGYTEDGQRLWLVSDTLAADIAFDQVVDLPMFEGHGGTFDQPAPSSEALSEWGRFKGLFDACGTGRFALIGNDGLKFTYQTKLAGITDADCTTETLPSPSGLAGLWYDPSLDGEGYNVIVTGNSTVFFYYGYDANGQRLWLVSDALSGSPPVGDAAIIKMFSAAGGTFDQPAPSSQALSDWGELQVTFNGCTESTAKLTGSDGEKTSNLVKLAGIENSTCP